MDLMNFSTNGWVNEFIKIGHRTAQSHNNGQISKSFIITPFERYSALLVAFGKILYNLGNTTFASIPYDSSLIKSLVVDDNVLLKQSQLSEKLVPAKFKGFVDENENRQERNFHSNEEIEKSKYIILERDSGKKNEMLQTIAKTNYFRISISKTLVKQQKGASRIDVNKGFVESIFYDPTNPDKGFAIYDRISTFSSLECILIGNKAALLQEADKRILRTIPMNIPGKNNGIHITGCPDDLVRYKNDQSPQHWMSYIVSSNHKSRIDWKVDDKRCEIKDRPLGIIEGARAYDYWADEFEYTSLTAILPRKKDELGWVEESIAELERNNNYDLEISLNPRMNTEIITFRSVYP